MHPEILVNDTRIDNTPVVRDVIDQPIQLYKSPRMQNSSLKLYIKLIGILSIGTSSGFPSIEIINHLTDIFFKHINSVFFFIHRPSFMKSIQDGTVSERLLYNVMAISSR
jgi:hypothetical protein